MRIGFIGCVESSLRLLETLLTMDNKKVTVVGVVTLSISSVNSDHRDLSEICKKYRVPLFFEDRKNEVASRDFLAGLKPDVVYCFGWSYLLEENMLDVAPFGVMGFHPAKLPQNRGRHPLIWALALGLEETASTFFKIESGADTGPILSQKLITIASTDNAGTLYDKILRVAETQVIEITDNFINGTVRFVEQDPSQATYWRKRSRKDGFIDWRMHAETVHNLIRALAEPYPGAEFKYDEKYIKVWDSKIAEVDYPKNIEPGTVLEVSDGSVLIKCADVTAVRIKRMSPQLLLREGEYL